MYHELVLECRSKKSQLWYTVERISLLLLWWFSCCYGYHYGNQKVYLYWGSWTMYCVSSKYLHIFLIQVFGWILATKKLKRRRLKCTWWNKQIKEWNESCVWLQMQVNILNIIVTLTSCLQFSYQKTNGWILTTKKLKESMLGRKEMLLKQNLHLCYQW